MGHEQTTTDQAKQLTDAVHVRPVEVTQKTVRTANRCPQSRQISQKTENDGHECLVSVIGNDHVGT